MLNVAEIFATEKRIRDYKYYTPLRFSHILSEQLGKEIYLKLENWQHTGAFKFRGALSRISLLSKDERDRGIITSSSGNHGLGVAAAAQIYGAKATVVLPENTPDAKTKPLKYYGANLVLHGEVYEEAEEEAHRLEKERGLTFVHGFEDPIVVAGQGTVGLEIFQQLPDAECVIVPVGGGGLIGGIAVAIKLLNPDIKLYGVQSVASPPMYESYRAGKMVEAPVLPTIAEGLAGRWGGKLGLELCLKFVDDMFLVEEDDIKDAIRYLLEKEKLIVEGSGAVGIAALLTGKLKPKEKKIVLVISGGNISHALLKELITA
jgi:threonine dehydratase